jgi:undecaprenyl-diphosphatase
MIDPVAPTLSFLQAFVMAVLQGVTELFPVSSLGHAVVLPPILGWHIDQKAPEFLPFLVVLHLGTAAALLLYFWRDWLGFARGVVGRGKKAKEERKVLGLVVVATLPAAIIGFALEHVLRGFFGSPVLAATFLIVNGGILFIGERIKHSGRKTLAEVGWKAALLIGACQALALIPGISRSGITLVGGVLAGLKPHAAARFTFLLATPVIAGAGVLEVPRLLHHTGGLDLPEMIAAGLVAGVTAWLSTAFLMLYFKKHEVEALDPFAWYCWAFGAVALVILL